MTIFIAILLQIGMMTSDANFNKASNNDNVSTIIIDEMDGNNLD